MHVLFSANMNPFNLPSKVLRSLFGSNSKKKEVPQESEELEKVIGYRFRSISLLRLALTHKSSNIPENEKGLLSNERLEFLGDSILNFLVTDHLYHLYPQMNEGELSKIKSLVVSRKILGEVAQSIELGKYLIFGISEEKSGGRDRLTTISNAFEALLGAVYLDSGIEEVKKILQRFLFKRIREFLMDERHINYKSKILELSQSDGFGIPKYVTVKASGPDHAKEFTVDIEVGGIVLGRGVGPNKKIAQQHAAREAIKRYSKEYIISHCKGASHHELVSH